MPGTVDRRAAFVAFVGAGVLLAGIALLVMTWFQLAPMAAAAPPVSGSIGIARAELTRVDLLSGGSEARYRSLEVLTGRGVNEAVGKTSDVTGSLIFHPNGTVLP